MRKNLFNSVRRRLRQLIAPTSTPKAADPAPVDLQPAPGRHRMFDGLDADPSIAWSLLRHSNGYLREAALKVLPGPISSASQLMAIVYLLNDWVPEVRAAALAAATRLFPTVLPDVVEASAPYLMSRWAAWQRWDSNGIALVDALVSRPEVVERIVHSLENKRRLGVRWQLSHMLRYSWIDAYLPRLARTAVHPSVRKLAYSALLNGEAKWRSGVIRSAEEIRYSINKSTANFESRQISVPVDRAALVEQGLHDRFAVVRWLAAGALVENLVEIPDRERAVTRLLSDKSRSIRERGKFLARRESIPFDS